MKPKAEQTELQLILRELRALRNEVKNNTAIMAEIRCLLDPQCEASDSDEDEDDIEDLLRSPRY
jgi:hypothetical protein